jgi:hypothetical protein
MNDNNNNTCTIVNTVWINKGIFLTILYYILKKYDILLDKIIIIDITRFRLLFRLLFPRLTFKKYEIDNKNNFYFNIRKIIKNQDVIIDYLNSYDSFIPTKKINLVPWFDMNDILISYTYNKKKKLYIDKYLNFIINFNKCRRGNYNNQIYDKFIENNIINRFLLFDTDYTLTKLNKILITYLHHYTDTVNNYIIPNNVIKSKRQIKTDVVVDICKQKIDTCEQKIDTCKQNKKEEKIYEQNKKEEKIYEQNKKEEKIYEQKIDVQNNKEGNINVQNNYSTNKKSDIMGILSSFNNTIKVLDNIVDKQNKIEDN